MKHSKFGIPVLFLIKTAMQETGTAEQVSYRISLLVVDNPFSQNINALVCLLGYVLISGYFPWAYQYVSAIRNKV